jgi:hypothetical protein
VRRSIWAPVLILALALVAGLIVSALKPMPIRAYALGSPNAVPVAVLARGQEACEGPIGVPAAVGAARVWGSTVGPAWIEVTVRDATTRDTIARGWTVLPPDKPHSGVFEPLPGDYADAAFAGAIRPGSTIDVCVIAEGPAPLSLAGSAPVDPDIVMSLGGKPTPTEFSLALLQASRRSLLAALPTAFARASLFRLSWTGPWTFWVLAVALLGTTASCGWAVAAAARADSHGEDRKRLSIHRLPVSCSVDDAD